MPNTLTYGRQIPITGERGSTVFTSLANNISTDDAHSHNGTDSAKLNPKDFAKTHTTLALASWVAVSGQAGTYKQSLTVPSGYTVNDCIPKFSVGSGSEAGTILWLTAKKTSATTMDVYINDNTIDVDVTYA